MIFMLKKKYYSDFYSTKWHSHKQDIIRLEIVKSLLGKNERVLDIGCYDGSISTFFVNNENCVFGCELSKSAAKIAKSRKINVVINDIEYNIPFGDECFDCVFAGEIIEHIFDTDSFLEEIKRVLVKNGILIITTPNLAGIWNRIRLLFGISIADPAFSMDGQHIRFFTKSTLSMLLKMHGFEIAFIKDTNLSLPIFSRFGVHFKKSFMSLGENIIVKAWKK